MLDLFEKKDIQQFSKSIRNVFNLLTISRKYRVAGSASLKNVRYVNDYDLNELYSKPLNSDEAKDIILDLFRNKFKEAKENPNYFITDLKCGEYNGEPLRWKSKDIERGYKTINGKKIKVQDCILSKTTFKMDVIAIIDGKYTEFSDIYYIKLGNQSNFETDDISPNKVKDALKDDAKELAQEGNLFKSLKRNFSYYALDGKTKWKSQLAKLLRFFNGKAGLLYKVRSDLATTQLILEQNFRAISKDNPAFRKNLEIVVAPLLDTPLKKDAKRLLSSPSIKKINLLQDRLLDLVNSLVNSFLDKNPNIRLF